jgi:hypothetical protein
MEKLIELIWEWQKETHPDGIYLPVVAYRDWIFWSDWDCLSSVMDEIHLISKPCRFIKWLVENEKINFDKLEIWLLRYGIPEDTVWFYEWLLMLLSISDEPIDYLCNILK